MTARPALAVRCPECLRGLTVDAAATVFGPHSTEVAPVDPQPCGGAGWLIEDGDVVVGRWGR